MSTKPESSLMRIVFEEFKKPARVAVFLFSILLFASPTLLTKAGISLSGTMSFAVEILAWISLIFSFKEICWRIKKPEYRFLLPLTIHASSIIFIYTLARIVKDPMSNSTMGNEVTIIIKCLVVVISVIYQALYNKLSRHFKLSSVVFLSVVPIVGYLALFCFYLYNNPSVVMSAATVARLTSSYPYLSRFIPIVANWPIALYYILAEVFAVSALQVFMWQIINSQIKREHSKRIIPALILVMQFPTMLAAKSGRYLSEMTSVAASLKLSAVLMVVSTIILIINNFIFFRLKVNIEGQITTLGEDHQIKVKKEENIVPLGVWDHIKKNYTFLLIAFLTVFYGLTSSWLEQFWKKNITIYASHKAQQTIHQAKNIVNFNNVKGADEMIEFLKLGKVVDKISAIKNYFGLGSATSNEKVLKSLTSRIYQDFFSSYIMRQARYSMIFLIFGTSILMEYLSWTAFASLTPIFGMIGTLYLIGLPLLSRVPFFSKPLIRFLGDTKSIFIVIVQAGAYIIACFKSLKYASFDPSKEQFIIRHSQEERTEIKYLEGYFNKFGKSGGSLFLAAIFGASSVEFTSTSVMTLLFIALSITLPLWILAVIKIGNTIKSRTQQ
jgi:ATP/ADP translocase